MKNNSYIRFLSSSRLASVLILVLLSSCSPLFVLRASYEETKILLARQKIEQAVADQKTPAKEKEKLKLVLAAREFAKVIGLTPKDSFTLYSKVDRNPLAWVFMASQPDSFKLKTWWFPFVGSVPYKGYFSKATAIEAAKEAEMDGWETWIRGTDAFSTLGWFNDPILSTTLSRDKFSIVNTVIHEILHSTLWVKNQVSFNESLANFIGVYGMLDFFEEKYEHCSAKSVVCATELKDLKVAQKIVVRETALAKVVDEMYKRLSQLYSSTISQEQKLNSRKLIFETLSKPLKIQYPELNFFETANNAELMQLKIYLTNFDLFKKIHHTCSEDWSCFLDKVRGAVDKSETNKTTAFAELEMFLEN
ncbi:MAG: aminopeptidase [Bdellovibrionota bacterium]